MSATDIDFDTEYRFYDETTRLNAFELTRRFMSLHLRLKDVELKGQGYDSLIEQGIGAALRRINEGVQPLLDDLLPNLVAAEQALAVIQARIDEGINASDIRFQPGGTALTSDRVQGAITELLSVVTQSVNDQAARQSSVNSRDLYLSGW